MADFNRDRRRDLAVNIFNEFGRRGEVRVLLGTGRGTFSRARRVARCCGGGALEVGYFNLGRKPDLARVSTSSTRVSVLINRTRR